MTDLEYLIQRVMKSRPVGVPIVSQSTPIVSFGDPRGARVATVGINPSRREFEKPRKGDLLKGAEKRLVDLDLLGLVDHQEISIPQATQIVEACFNYFNPSTYLREWFDPLEHAILRTVNASYLDGSACHLDLVQWATDPLWGSMADRATARALLHEDSEFLKYQLANYSFEVIFLNGREVCDQVEDLGIYELREIGELSWKSGARVNTSKIKAARGPSGELVVGWTLNLQAMKVVNDERERIYNELGNWIRSCMTIDFMSPGLHSNHDVNEPSLGAEDLVEAIINRLHFGQSKDPRYLTTKINLLRENLGLSQSDARGHLLEEVLEGYGALTTHILPTDGALELSPNIPIGAATFAVLGRFPEELARMRADLIDINREFLTVLIAEILGSDALRRVPLSTLIASGLPETEPPWGVFDWIENY